ncbi:MAG: transcription antitermination factor NusB [Alphaproteobacteria bacterium]
MLSSARLAAVQAIYQLEMSGGTADAVVAEFVRHRGGAELDEGGHASDTDQPLFAALVRGVAEKREELDGMIAGLLVADWPLARIEKVLAAVLRAGAFELMYRPSVPARVVINEYVDVAHAFLAGREVGMVNGVLDRLARVLRAAEMGEVEGGKGEAGDEPAG